MPVLQTCEHNCPWLVFLTCNTIALQLLTKLSELYFPTCVHKSPGLVVVVVHHNHSHLRAKTSLAQVALTHMKNKLENALETNSNLQISNLAQVQT